MAYHFWSPKVYHHHPAQFALPFSSDRCAPKTSSSDLTCSLYASRDSTWYITFAKRNSRVVKVCSNSHTKASLISHSSHWATLCSKASSVLWACSIATLCLCFTSVQDKAGSELDDIFGMDNVDNPPQAIDSEAWSSSIRAHICAHSSSTSELTLVVYSPFFTTQTVSIPTIV